jgi:hypothetical protein
MEAMWVLSANFPPLHPLIELHMYVQQCWYSLIFLENFCETGKYVNIKPKQIYCEIKSSRFSELKAGWRIYSVCLLSEQNAYISK